MGLYTPRSLRGASLRPWGSLPRLVAELSSALVRRLEDPKTRLGAGRGHFLWIFSSVALLSGFGFKLKSSFCRCVRGVHFLVQSDFLPSGSCLVLELTLAASPSRAPRERGWAQHVRRARRSAQEPHEALSGRSADPPGAPRRLSTSQYDSGSAPAKVNCSGKTCHQTRGRPKCTLDSAPGNRNHKSFT